jgi:N-methylhydantoinase B
MAIDPITLTLVQNRLDHVCQQMSWVMVRTARSPLFSQAKDFSCFVTDAAGYVMAQADGVPMHTGGGGFAVRAILAAFGNDIAAGDVFLLNDPYAAGGNHLPDWLIALPVFVDGVLVAFCNNRGHQSDVGGGVAGGFNANATEIYQEGIRLPPLRLARGEEVRADLWQLLLLNSRTPNLLDGDLRAMLGSTKVGVRQVEALAAELTAAAAIEAFAGILEVGERRMRAEIAALPDGTYRGEDATDSDCFAAGNHVIRVALTVAGDRLQVDFAGTDPQMRGFKNSSLANTYSAVYVALATFLSPDLPGNEGTFRAVEIVAPEGSLVNPRAPAPVAMSTLCMASEIIHAVWKALAQADPQRSCAGYGKINYPITSGRDADGTPFVLYHWSAGVGGGAVDGRDGFNANGGLINLGALRLPDVEGYEQSYPVHFLAQEFRTDAAGAGRFRGGTGISYRIEIEAPTVMALRGEGLVTPSGFGAAGGATGRAGEMTVAAADGSVTVPPKYGVLNCGPMQLAVASAAGGGWGDPFTRDPAAVLRDVRDLVVSREAAARDYGVAIAADGRSVDQARTAALRAMRRG